MTQPDLQTNLETSSGAQPKSLEQMLDEITAEITSYESRKLQQIKRELDAFVSAKKSVVDEYKSKYIVLKDKWCTQNSDVNAIKQHLDCIFKEEDRKKHIADCICKETKQIEDDSKAIETRKACGKGKKETTRDAAKAAYDAAKADLDALKANAQRIDTELTANQKTIAEIQTLLQGRERAVAIWPFWFTLLPSHRQLMPNAGSLPKDCTVPGEGESPSDLCKPKEEGKPEEEDKPKKVEEKPGRSAPWLIDPDLYDQALNAAWTRYKAAQEVLGKAEADYAAAPDDLAAAEKTLADRRKGLDAKVRDCLKKLTSTEPCCPPTTN